MTTTPESIRAALFDALAGIAPDADPSALTGGERFRDALDLDSMDFLALMRAMHERTGVDVPESAYGELDTLDRIVAWFAARVAMGRGTL